MKVRNKRYAMLFSAILLVSSMHSAIASPLDPSFDISFKIVFDEEGLKLPSANNTYNNLNCTEGDDYANCVATDVMVKTLAGILVAAILSKK